MCKVCPSSFSVSDRQTGCWCVSRPAAEELEVSSFAESYSSGPTRCGSLSNSCGRFCTKPYLSLPPAELPLKMLTVKVGGSQTEVEWITRVLQRAPHLTSFHLCGLRLATGWSQAKLLTTLSGTVQGQHPPVAPQRLSLQTKGLRLFSTSQSPTVSCGVSSWRTQSCLIVSLRSTTCCVPAA